ncbi:MAG: hypothetical protein LBT95_01940, partial [Treponema sp.]|nr:hypothetical protein [Treponema sp.]
MTKAKWWGDVETRPGTPERAENVTRALGVLNTELEKMGGRLGMDIHIEESAEYTYETVTLKIFFETLTLAEYVSRLP